MHWRSESIDANMRSLAAKWWKARRVFSAHGSQLRAYAGLRPISPEEAVVDLRVTPCTELNGKLVYYSDRAGR